MKRIVVIVVLLASAHGQAGEVEFSPNDQAVGVVPFVEMTLTLRATGAVTDISAADVVIGSDLPFTFAYSDEWLAAMANVTSPTSIGFYAHDLLVGGSHPTVGAGRSLELGTITVDTTGLWPDMFLVSVNNDLDGISGISRGLPGQEFAFEPVSGEGRFYYGVPEPGTLVLLGVGAFVVVRRWAIGSAGNDEARRRLRRGARLLPLRRWSNR